MTNALVVHGTFGKPFENWFPWLESELAKLETPCMVPQFPTPKRQNYANWEKLLAYYVSIGVVSDDTFLIGHSSGSPFLIKYLLNNPLKIKGLITVSGFNRFVSGIDAFDALNSDFYFDSDTNTLKKSTENIQCFMSDNDPYLPANILNEFAKSISGVSHLVKGAGHFNTESGFNEFQQLVEFIKSS